MNIIGLKNSGRFAAPNAGTAISVAIAATLIGSGAAVLPHGPDAFLHGLQLYSQSRPVLRAAALGIYVAVSFITAGLLLAGAVLRRFNKPFLPYYGYACVGLFLSAMSATMLWSGVGLEEVIEDCWGGCGFPH